MSIWSDIKQAEKKSKELEKRIATKEARLREKGVVVDYSSIEKFENRPTSHPNDDNKSIYDTIRDVHEMLNAKLRYLEHKERECDEELKRI